MDSRDRASIRESLSPPDDRPIIDKRLRCFDEEVL